MVFVAGMDWAKSHTPAKPHTMSGRKPSQGSPTAIVGPPTVIISSRWARSRPRQFHPPIPQR